MSEGRDHTALRRGWTTGACATAAARAAFEALVSGGPPPDPVEIALPSGQRVAFALAEWTRQPNCVHAGVIKDAGDDPDVTHGALVRATVRLSAPGSGVTFFAGEGVGVVTRPGLPLPPGEPAINPIPRAMMRQTLAEAAERLGVAPDAQIEISIPGGVEMAKHTLNGRLGIVGGLSILGTTGIVTPFSCAAWIDSIHRGVDVARACGLTHIAAATGSTSETAIQKLYDLPDVAMIEMGDFVGGFLKYLRAHPVARVTVGGGFAKMTKLAQGRLDLHSGRSTLDLLQLAQMARSAGAPPDLTDGIAGANSALEALQLAQAMGIDLAAPVAARAWETAAHVLNSANSAFIELEILVFDRAGVLLARAPFRSADA
jgi:cobalt-precorrin-5B (C1)-methyltransferase